MMETKQAGLPAFGAAIAMALSLASCGEIRFEEYPSVTITERVAAQAETTRAPGDPAPTPEFFTDPGQAWIVWMDHLKTCTPYSQSYQNPYLKNTLAINTILGKDGDYCLVTMQTADYAILTCRLDANGVETLTRDELYAQTTDVYSAQPDTLSMDVMTAQCEYKILTSQ